MPNGEVTKSSTGDVRANAEAEGVLGLCQSLLETGVSGKPTGKDLERIMRRVAARLRRDFAQIIAADARKFKKQATHYLKRYLPTFAGRPSEGSITRAIELRKLGYQWKEIYPQVVADHSHLDPAVRRQVEASLRAALRSEPWGFGRLNFRRTPRPVIKVDLALAFFSTGR